MLRAGCILAVVASMLAVSVTPCLSDDVSVRTSSDVYETGDTVYFSIVNGTPEAVTFGRDPIYNISDSTGFVVYPVGHDEADITWEPGRSENFAWSQTDGAGEVPLGLYFVWVEYYTVGGGFTATSADTFRIVTTGCTVDCVTSWGHIKSLYR